MTPPETVLSVLVSRLEVAVSVPDTGRERVLGKDSEKVLGRDSVMQPWQTVPVTVPAPPGC